MTLYHIRMSRPTFHVGPFAIEPQAGGNAYVVTDTRTGASFFSQDDSAQQLEADSNGFENLDVLSEYMATLGEKRGT